MNFLYENQGSVTYLVYRAMVKDELDSMTLGMLSNNEIPGIAETIQVQMDNIRYVKYNISAKITLRQYFQGMVKKDQLIGVLDGIADAMLGVEEYMIDMNCLVLDEDYIFVNVSTGEIAMICLPIEREASSGAILRFFMELMLHTQFDQSENGDHVVKLLNYFNGTSEFSAEDFKQFLRSLKGNGKAGRKDYAAKRADTQVTKSDRSKMSDKALTIQEQPMASQVPAKQPGLSEYGKELQIEAPGPQYSGGVTPQANAVTGYQVPQTPGQQRVAQTANTKDTGEEDISLIYLLQHYNKDRAAQYKAQKAVKKANKQSDKIAKKAEKEAQKEAKKAAKRNKHNKAAMPQGASFAVPGQPQLQGAQLMNQGQQPPIPAKNMPPSQGFPGADMAAIPQTSVRELTNVGNHIPPVPPVMPPVQEEEMTMILDAGMMNSPDQRNGGGPYILRLKNGEKISLGESVFKIGKQRDAVDYCITDNRAISRVHAIILCRSGQYYITDAGSTNHTRVDGTVVMPDTEIPIMQGTRIALANEEFEFHAS